MYTARSSPWLNMLRPRVFLSPLSHRLLCRLSTKSPAYQTMSLKTIAVLDEAELKDGEMKQVVFEGDGKVLLSRLGDKIHATSAFCTHYGAPLAKGVLTADGELSACFNICTGDIEDAPAPSALHSFKAHIADGKIHVTADPANTLSAPPKTSTGASGQGRGVVIVGGGGGAFHCVESLARYLLLLFPLSHAPLTRTQHGYLGPITVLSKESHAPIDRTRLSKALVTDASKLEWRSAAELQAKFGVALRTSTEVRAVDLGAKAVELVAGAERVPYDKLILATGGVPRRLPVPGAQLANVFTMARIEDARKIDAEVQEGKRLVMIGSSFISMELVVAVSQRKLASIDVIGMEEVPFELVLGKAVGRGLKKFHEGKGVRFYMQAKVGEIVPAEGDPSRAGAVVVTSSTGERVTLPADVVVMGVGVAPATQFLKASKGFEEVIDRSGAVHVDEFMRVKGMQDVYAIGDIAMYPQPGTGELRRIEHWNVASNQGRAVGKTIAEGKGQPFVKVPIFWSARACLVFLNTLCGGQQLRYCGIGAGFDDVIIDGNTDEMKFVAYYLKGDKVVAVASMQRDPVVMKASELLRLGLMPSPAELRAGKDLLSVDIQTVGARSKLV
ncbi:Apoptosis-inducing factor 1 [Grifola frondosa]|uniref:Apoptosis-inducing factor 1 n=1 Tax=Grifola frondosa TaxID=5627 RepID=A0A1C7M7E3_GRIFR|nr:Apoptosis-inducing factor 1 [Grifola frondosa]